MIIFAVAAVIGVAWIVSAWLLMLTIGVVHLHWIPQLPTLGYPLALLITVLAGLRSGLAAALIATVRTWMEKAK